MPNRSILPQTRSLSCSGHPKKNCSLSLRESPRADQIADLNHQISSDLEILCFLGRKSEISKYVVWGLWDLDCHEIS